MDSSRRQPAKAEMSERGDESVLNGHKSAYLSVVEPFQFEKLQAEIDLPSKGLVWPSLKAKLQMHIAANGGAMFNSLRWAARYGVDRLLQNSGISTCDNLRVSASRTDLIISHYSEALTACALANGCSELDALDVLLAIGARHGEANGYRAPEESAAIGKRRV
jgi:hypothetical protein